MCISPNLLSDGQSTACRKCWQCLEHRVDNWVGRCIAESKSSAVSVFITLTYGRDEHGNESHARAAILTYSDVQKYFKQLRNRKLKFRYLVVGEIGSKKGRTHWHVIVFFKHALPDGFWDYGCNSWHRAKREDPVFVPLVWSQRFNEPCWPHGFSQWDPLHNGHTKGGVRYACKYINKDVDDAAAQSKLCMSKQPPLGAHYFEQRAQKYVDEGIAPQDPFYMFPDEAKRISDGKPIRFRLAGKSADLFCQHFIDKWTAQRPGQHWPHSELIEEYEDRTTRAEWDREAQALEERIRPIRRWQFDPPMGYVDKDIVASEYGPMVKTPDGPLWYGPDNEGKRAWRNVHPVEAKRLPHRHLPELSPCMTQSGWVGHLSQRCVFWISRGSASLGRWKTARTIPANGKPVWLRSYPTSG
jgi:hypothetical protein